MSTFEQLHHAVKQIETLSIGGVIELGETVGKDVALALSIMRLRMSLGSLNYFPPLPEIDEKVVEFFTTQFGPEILENKAVRKITFYLSEWSVFDNFSAFQVIWKNQVWATAEHAYQAAKFTDRELVSMIQNSTSPHEAKKLGQEYKSYRNPDWDKPEIKLATMEGILRTKRDQHLLVRQKLRETDGAELVEDSPTDSFWGSGPDGKGANHSGKLWMKLRSELQ